MSHINLGRMRPASVVREVLAWLRNEAGYDYDDYEADVPDLCVLNVAGSRESKADGIQELVGQVMLTVLAAK